jgi:benzoyl-CoA reductase subunit C
MHFPEELVHASGALPVVLQQSNEMVTKGWDYLPAQFCAFTRSNVDAIVKGQLDFFDAIILSDFCLQLRIAFHIGERHLKAPFIYMWWPPEYDYERGLSSAKVRLDKVRKQIEGVTGVEITDEAISRSIRIYNRNRELLRAIDGFRATKPGVISVTDMQLLVQSSMLMEKERHNEILERVLADLETAAPVTNGEARLFLSGHLCHAVRASILGLIEEAGGLVVGDDLYTGRRYYAAQVDEDAPPIEAIIQRWFDPGLACPEKVGGERNWMQELVDDVRRTNAEGVVSFMPKHCEPHMFFHPGLKDRLADERIPMLLIQTEHEALGIEGNKTRFQALVETLKGARR